MTGRPRATLWAFRLATVTLALALVVAPVELFFRAFHAPPRVAIISANAVEHFRLGAHGIPLWASRGARIPPCSERRPGATRLTFLGSSITFGSGVRREEAFPAVLEGRFDSRQPGSVCVDNLAEVGYAVAQEYATALDVLATTKPAVVVWEVYDTQKRYAVAGDIAFDARGRTLDAAGVPVLSRVPSWLADPLFRHSAAYRYAALALAPVLDQDPASPVDYLCDVALPDIQRRVASYGGELVVLRGAPLYRPLQKEPEDRVASLVDVCARAAGARVTSIGDLLAGEPVEGVRIDPVCHLNVHGHTLLAERLEPVVRAELGKGTR